MPWELWKGKKQGQAAPRGHRCEKPPLNSGKGWHAVESDRCRCPVCLSVWMVDNWGGPAKREWSEFSFDDQMHDLEAEVAQAGDED